MSFPIKTAFVTLAAFNFEELTEFYKQLLDRPPSPFIPSVYAEFQLSNLRLGIFKPKQTHLSEFPTQPSGMSLCLEVENLEAAIQSIEQAYANTHPTAIGYPPSGDIITASHGREIYAYDPAGNRLILHESN